MNLIGLTGGPDQALELAAERALAAIAAGSYRVAVCLFYRVDVARASALRRNVHGFTEIWHIGPYSHVDELFRHGQIDAFLGDGEQLPHRVDAQLRMFLHLIDQCRAVPAALHSLTETQP